MKRSNTSAYNLIIAQKENIVNCTCCTNEAVESCAKRYKDSKKMGRLNVVVIAAPPQQKLVAKVSKGGQGEYK